MAYITDEKGRVKIISSKGKTKFVTKLVAENAKVMTNTGYSIVEAPEKYEPVNYTPNEAETDTDFEPELIEDKPVKKTIKRK